MFHLIVGWFTLVAEVHKRAATGWTHLRQVPSLVCEQWDQEAEGERGGEGRGGEVKGRDGRVRGRVGREDEQGWRKRG